MDFIYRAPRATIRRTPTAQPWITLPQFPHDTCYLAQVPHIPTWSDLTGSLAGLGRRALLPFSPTLM